MRTMTGRGGVLAVLALALAAGCAKEPPAPTTVTLEITAAEDMNGGAPTRLSVYYLNAESLFAKEDFFALTDAPGATLGNDLVERDQYLLSPGDTITDTKSFDAAVPIIGAVAAFRNVDQPGWRTLGQLEPRAANAVQVTLSGSTVTLEKAGLE